MIHKVFKALAALFCRPRKYGHAPSRSAPDKDPSVRLGSLLHKTAHRRAVTIAEFRERALYFGWRNVGYLTHETKLPKRIVEPIIEDILNHKN